MKKKNKIDKFSYSMLAKYGPDWDTPINKKNKISEKDFYPQHNFVLDSNLVGTASASPSVNSVSAADNKSDVYHNLSTEYQRLKVLEIIKSLGHATDNDISRVLKIPSSTVSARRNELYSQKLVQPVIDFYGKKVKKTDPITGHPNVLWKLYQK